MKFIKKIINIVIYILIKFKLLKLPKKSLRVLMFHNIDDFETFKNQIYLLKKKWKILSPKDFYKIINGKKKITKRCLLLTFDDGFKSNITVADKILRNENLKAIIFVPLKFILLKKKSDKKNFIRNNLKVKSISSNMDSLDIKDLKKFKKLDFVIGSHTFSHANLKKLSNKKKLKFEIVDSANRLQKLLKININNFSFTFGRLDDISQKSLKISKNRFNYIFTGIRGENLNKSKLIFRDNVLPNDRIYDLYAYLSGYYDFLYSNERKIIKKNFRKIV
ncbi:polysaccharide deacetylase family protein [Pelagibacterales bacterium SAG-MED47]|nr:polysaccharide deacetylase family protein [Pelagibacterales bacterium SAG-MED47]